MYDTIIIGAGIAGCTAAIYASRKRMDYLFITDRFGGQSNEVSEILNYPGIIKTTGPELLDILSKQLKATGVKLQEGVAVKSIKKHESYYKVQTNKGVSETKTVIIASGGKPKKLGVPNEDKYAAKGVHYCTICDGPLYSGKDVAIIGGGNSALESAMFMEKIARKIYLVNIKKSFTAHEYLIDRVKKQKNVQIISEAKTKSVLGDKFVNGLEYERGRKTEQLKVQGIFVDIGRVPNTEFVKGFLKLDDDGHIKVDETTAASLPGIFAAGDCASSHEYQYIIAAGQGCTALLKAARFLAKKA